MDYDNDSNSIILVLSFIYMFEEHRKQDTVLQSEDQFRYGKGENNRNK